MPDRTEDYNKPEVDVIIPVYKPGDGFKNILKRLLKQTVPVRHIFLLQTLEEDGRLMEVPGGGIISVHPVLKKDFDHGGTRRYGAGLSDAEFILFMTHDAIPRNSRLIENLLVPMADKNIAISYGRQLASKDADILEKMTRIYNYPKESSVKSINDIEKLGIKTYFCSDVCAMYRRSVYEELGGFVEKTIFNEDMIMASKVIGAGYNIAYCADAGVIHSHSYTCLQQFKRNFDLGVSQKQYHEVFANISSEKEGAGYAKKVIKNLVKRRKIYKAFYFMLQCVFKLAGYKAGLNYDKLPEKFILKCTMNKGYWN
ncbi:MAG: glycosyltransferase family 2 protein [Lachnospiraceae bacterium]|nr:glycosyltransferase family 2 protein [Lachnospiraceae bacterium]